MKALIVILATILAIHLVYRVGYRAGVASVPKAEEKPPMTAEEKDRAYETVFTFYTIGCAEALELVKQKLHSEGDVESYCKAATLDYRKRWNEANP